MRIGYGNYVYKNFKHQAKIYFIKHRNATSKRGIIEVGNITFPPEHIGKKVRIKFEFVEEKEEE